MVLKEINKYIRCVPASPLAGIAFSKSRSMEEVLRIAIDLREAFKSYRELLATYRQLQAKLAGSETFAISKELDAIDNSFRQALRSSMSRINTDLDIGSKVVFDGFQGVRKLVVSLGFGDFKSVIDMISENLGELIRSWFYMNYGGVYEIVSQYPKMGQLSAASRRLVNKELDMKIANVINDASSIIKSNYGLTGIAE
jgi:hypothetical protein